MKREVYVEASAVWDKRMALVNLKRQNPNLAAKDDEDLLFDKERVVKRPKISEVYVFSDAKARGVSNLTHFVSLRIKPTNRQSGEISASPTPVEPLMRPKDRFAAIHAHVEAFVKRSKEGDYGWEDQTDVRKCLH